MLIELGVKAHLLEEIQDLDLALLYQRLRLITNPAYLELPLQCKDRWQLEALAGGESYKTINYTIRQRDNWGATPFHYLCLSGNHQTLSQALARSPTPQSWALCRGFDEASSKTITDTLVKALNTNYSLTRLDFNGFSMDEDSQVALAAYLSRNMEIKRAKVMFIAFMQGLSQSGSEVSLLNFGQLEICSQILSYLLPKGVETGVLFKEIQTNINHQSRALALIDKEIKRLEASNQQNNTFLGIPLNAVYQNSDAKISCLQELREIIDANPTDLADKITTWEEKNQASLAVQRATISSSFFNAPLNKTQEAVQQIKQVLGVGVSHNPINQAQESSVVEEVDGFVVCK